MLSQVALLLEEGGEGHRGDPLWSLQAALNRVVELAHLVEEFELEPSEVELKDNGRELTGFKAKIQSLAQSLMTLDNPAIAREAHELAREVNEVISRGQRRIRKLLRRLGYPGGVRCEQHQDVGRLRPGGREGPAADDP
jgi:hypothetical protein